MFRSLHRLIGPKPRTLERDEIPLLLESGTRIAIQRVRDPRAKRIKLSVDERGARLTLPMRASLVSGDRFLHEHRDWLSLQLEKYMSHDTAPALARNLTRTLPLRGEEQPLHWHEGRYTRVVLDADGLHVGGTDASVAQVRARLGTGKIVGASCYGDLALAHVARAGGASYVAFGGFYPSLVKKYPVTTPQDIVLQAKREIALPCVVIGGMTAENAAPLVARGADMVAAISSVYGNGEQADAVDIAVQQFNLLFAREGAARGGGFGE